MKHKFENLLSYAKTHGRESAYANSLGSPKLIQHAVSSDGQVKWQRNRKPYLLLCLARGDRLTSPTNQIFADMQEDVLINFLEFEGETRSKSTPSSI